MMPPCEARRIPLRGALPRTPSRRSSQNSTSTTLGGLATLASSYLLATVVCDKKSLIWGMCCLPIIASIRTNMDKTVYSGSKRTSASNGVGSPKGDIGGSRRLSSYLQSAAQISGVVTIIAATVYALGVFTLVLPIANSYNSTFAAAWYAVSVVPQTVVVGHGIKSVVWPSLALTLATTLFALTMLWVLHTLSIGWHHARAATERPAAATERPALSPFSMVMNYAILSIILFTIASAVIIAVFGLEAV